MTMRQMKVAAVFIALLVVIVGVPLILAFWPVR